MTYTYTILYVPNVQQTLDFYQKAFGFSLKFCSPEGDYGELITGETTLAFASNELGRSNFKDGFEELKTGGKPWGVELGFVTEHIEADFQKALEAGCTAYEPIRQKPWGQKVGYVRDLNGFLIEFCTPVSS